MLHTCFDENAYCMNIRIAVEDDRQAILECVDDAYRKYIDRIGKKPAPMLAGKEAGLQEVRLYTNELMNENLLYYPKFGFIELNRTTEDGYRRVYMSKSL